MHIYKFLAIDFMPASIEPHDSSSSGHHRQGGRPTKHAHLSIVKTMQKYFEEGISAPSAARLAGVNIKTACAHYNEITKKFKEQNYDDMIKREESERAQLVGTFDNEIIELTDLLDDVRDEIQVYKDDGRQVPPILISQALSIMKSRHAVKERKFAYVIKPTLKELSQHEEGESNDES